MQTKRMQVYPRPVFPLQVYGYHTNPPTPRVERGCLFGWYHRLSELLLELAQGKKTFRQVQIDVKRYRFPAKRLRQLAQTNAARGVTERLTEITGISKESLHFSAVRCKPDAGHSDSENEGPATMQLPFALLSTTVSKCLAADPNHFEIALEPVPPNVAASSFVNSPEYRNHDLVREVQGTGETVVPVGLYSDGVKVGEAPHEDSIYAIYVFFPHLGIQECAKPGNKHVFTVYRKSEATKETLEDIWKVLLWDLQALAKGRLPQAGEEGKPLSEQTPGDYLHGNWGSPRRCTLR